MCFRNASLGSDGFERGLDDRGRMGVLRVGTGSWSLWGAPQGWRSPPDKLAEEGKGKPETRLRVPSPSKETLGDSGGEGYLQGHKAWRHEVDHTPISSETRAKESQRMRRKFSLIEILITR